VLFVSVCACLFSALLYAIDWFMGFAMWFCNFAEVRRRLLLTGFVV
jgi:hypothetical protein